MLRSWATFKCPWPKDLDFDGWLPEESQIGHQCCPMLIFRQELMGGQHGCNYRKQYAAVMGFLNRWQVKVRMGDFDFPHAITKKVRATRMNQDVTKATSLRARFLSASFSSSVMTISLSMEHKRSVVRSRMGKVLACRFVGQYQKLGK